MEGFPKFLRQILAPIDFDDASPRVLEVARELASQRGARVVLLHVVPAFEVAVPEWHQRPAEERARGTWPEEAAREQLAELTREHLAGVSHETLLRVGNPAWVIVDTVEERSPDLVVIATHGRTGAERLFLGSVAERVIRGSSRPVLVVPPRRGG